MWRSHGELPAHPIGRADLRKRGGYAQPCFSTVAPGSDGTSYSVRQVSGLEPVTRCLTGQHPDARMQEPVVECVIKHHSSVAASRTSLPTVAG